MERRVASVNVTLEPMTIAPVTPTEAYFGIAETLLPGAQLLAASAAVPGTALTLVSGHLLECLLKALLSKKEATERELMARDVRHNLGELWRRSVARGCPVSPTLPPWAERLDALHNEPYRLRYPVGLNGLVLPEAQPMASELQELLEVVRRAIR